MTSLRDSDALYHAAASLIQRSKGRSAVAAAAYRAAAFLHDERIDRVFDYRRKHSVGSFIVAPDAAPEWVQDRQELWNRIERAEVNKRAQLAREWEISIPRDIPQEHWKSFASDVARPFVDAGAIADIAIHCPKAADGEKQPHLHIMLTLRKLDSSTETGFAKKKNNDLESLHTSGGRYGGKRGDALKIQRERIAFVMNSYLEMANSPRRVSHLSNQARGIDREPEPKMGEMAKAIAVKNRRHTRKTKQISSMRKAHSIENKLVKIQEELMAKHPKYQNKEGRENGLKRKHQQDYKLSLLENRFPEIDFSDHKDNLYRVSAKSKNRTVVVMRDGSSFDVRGGIISVYGKKDGSARAIAKRIVDAGMAHHEKHVPHTASLRKSGNGLRPVSAPHDATIDLEEMEEGLDDFQLSKLEQRAEWWRERGYHDVSIMPDGVWVSLGKAKLQDLGDELKIHGKPSDDATQALIEKAVTQWGSEAEIFGSQDFKERCWIEAQRQGVTLYDADTGKPFEPSAAVKKQYEADVQKSAVEEQDISDVQAQTRTANLVRSAAAGNKASRAQLKSEDAALYAFVGSYLAPDQRADLSMRTSEEIIESLPAFRTSGQVIIDQDKGEGESELKPDAAADIDLDDVMEDSLVFDCEPENESESPAP